MSILFVPKAGALPIPIALEDWGEELNEWDETFIERHTIYHIEDLQSADYDAATILDPPSYQYLHFSNISWDWYLDGPINDLREHEDVFLHHSEPAGLVAFQGSDNRVELRWRLDYRSFVTGDNITVRDTGTEVRTYRVQRGTSPGVYTQTFTPAPMNGDEGVFTDTTTNYGTTYYYKIESIHSGEPIGYSGQVEIEVIPGGSTEPVFWLKSRSFVEECYVKDSDTPLEFKESLRFGSANVDPTADVYLAIVRDSGKIGLCGPGENDKLAPKEVKSTVHYKYDSYWDGGDLVFPQFGSNLQNGTGGSVGDITECEIYNAGCFPFVLHYEDGIHELEFPRSNQEWPTPRFSAALNNRSVTFNWPYYTVQPDHQAWRDAVRDECERIVTDAPGDWRQGRPAYDGVFADVVEWTLPGWINILEPGDYDAVSYGPGMEAVCSAAQAGMGAGKTLLINGFDQQFLGNSDIDRFYVDGLVKDQENVRWTGSYVNRANACRSLILASVQSGQPVTLRSQAGIIYDDQTGYTRLYRMMDLLFYWLVTEDNVDPLLVPSLSYAGSSIYDDRTMSFPESQIRLQPDGPGIYTSSYPWEAVRSFNQGEAFIIYNHDDFFSPGASLQADAVLSGHGYSVSGDWYKMVLPDTLTTTEGGRIEFVECDLNTEVIDPAHGLLIMKHPPVLPRVLADAYSPVWLTGGEPELEIKVMYPDTTTIALCEVSIHELKGLAEPESATMYEIMDDGLGADDVSGDGVYTLDLTTEIGSIAPGEYEVWVYAEDDNGYYQYARTSVRIVDDDLAVKFSDRSAISQISYDGVPYSTLAFDINKDNYDDLLITTQEDVSACSVKTSEDMWGNPIYSDRFVSRFENTTFELASNCRGIALGDYDNDGDEDLFVAHASDRILLENRGPQATTQFIDSTVPAITSAITEDSWAGAWGDFNGDSWLDLYISRAQQPTAGKQFVDADPVSDRLMLGVDGAQFVSASWFSGILADAQPSFAATWCDVERDGDMDLFVPAGNADGTSRGARFYEAIPTDDFQDALEDWFPNGEITNVTSAAWADLDNDGRIDLILSQAAPADLGQTACPYLFLYDGSAGYFVRNTSALPDIDLPTWDVRPLDFDLDGWMDLLLIPAKLDEAAPDHQPKLFRNIAADPLGFEDVSDASGIADLTSVINGVAIADFNLDGSLDAFLGRPTTENAGFFYLSQKMATPHWLSVRLTSAADILGNRSCIGSQVMVKNLDGTQILAGAQTYGGGTGRGGDVSRGLVFGLGAVGSSVVVETHWMNGFVQLDTLAVDQEDVVIVDRTPTDIVQGSFKIILGHGTQELFWDFEWNTKYRLASSVDQVEISGPGTHWNTVTLTPQNATYYVDGCRRAFYGFSTDCDIGPYTVKLTLSSNGQSYSYTKYYRVQACLVSY